MAEKINPALIIKGGIAVAIIVAILVINPFVVVGAGERGVVFSKISGVNENPLKEGINFVMPLINSVELYSVRNQKFESTSECSTADLQDIRVKLAVNFRIKADKVPDLHQKIGTDYIDVVIVPSMKESLKAATAKFKIEEVVTKRKELRKLTFDTLRDKLIDYNIIMIDVSIMNISFSEKYTHSVEEKQVAQQEFEKEKYLKSKEQIKAESKIIRARAKAKEQQLLRQTVNKDIIALKWIEKWNGKLPTYTGGSSKWLMPIK